MAIFDKISTHNATHNETSDQNRVNQGLLRLISIVEIEAYGPPPPYHKAPRLGPRAFSGSVVDSLGGNFVWARHLYSRINFKLNRAATLAEWRHLLSA